MTKRTQNPRRYTLTVAFTREDLALIQHWADKQLKTVGRKGSREFRAMLKDPHDRVLQFMYGAVQERLTWVDAGKRRRVKKNPEPHTVLGPLYSVRYIRGSGANPQLYEHIFGPATLDEVDGRPELVADEDILLISGGSYEVDPTRGIIDTE
ncbi:MAG: hypothetical protein V3U45_07080 [bacterium]